MAGAKWMVPVVGVSHGISITPLWANDANGANVFHCHFDPDRRCGAGLSSSSPVRGDPAAQIAAGLWD